MDDGMGRFGGHRQPDHLQQVEADDEQRKRLLCLCVLPALVAFHLASLASQLSGPTLVLGMSVASLILNGGLLVHLMVKGNPYITMALLGLWSHAQLLSMSASPYGVLPELFGVQIACLPPILIFVFGLRVGTTALVLALVEGVVFWKTGAFTCMSNTASSVPDSTLMGVTASVVMAFVVGLSALLQDTSRKAYRDHMQSIVHQFEVAHQELKQATAAQSNFLANMSHELRTPLHGITAMARELLETLSSRSPARECAEIIADSSDHMLGLVSDILDFERIENNRLDLENIPFSILFEADKAITILTVAAKQKGITVEKDYRVALPMHIGDPLRFRQILFNLVSNAIKFTPEGGHVWVSVENDEAEEELITVRVKDSGIGIAEEHKSHLFNCFSQVDSSIRRRYGGSGLGLAISKRLCEAMSGDIGYHSELGKGSTFHFSVRLPIFTPHTESYCEWAPFSTSGEVPLAPRNRSYKQASASSPMNRQKTLSSSVLCSTQPKSLFASSRIIPRLPIPKSPSASSVSTLAATSPPPSPGMTSSGCFSVSSLSASLLTSLSPFSSPSPSFSNLSATPSFSSLSSASFSSFPLGSPRGCLEGKRILLVEDNEVNQKVAKRMISSLGCHVTQATNGEVCLNILDKAKEPFHVILMDCQMPILDGFHATLKIREKEKAEGLPRTPIVALTASATKEYQQKCFSVGMDDFLSKPFTKTMLTKVLKRWVSAQEAVPQEF